MRCNFYILSLYFRCGEGRHPLLNTIRNVLAAPGSGTQEIVTAAPPSQPEDEKEQPSEGVPPSEVEEYPPSVEVPGVEPLKPQTTTTTAKPLVDKDSDYKVVCYFTNWAWYRQGVGKYLPSDIDPNLCTHIVYGFAVLNGDQLIIKPHDSWADFDNSKYYICRYVLHYRIAKFRT